MSLRRLKPVILLSVLGLAFAKECNIIPKDNSTLYCCEITDNNLAVASAKYKQYIEDMLTQNYQLFDAFLEIHNKYMENPSEWQAQFNEVGSRAQDVIRKYENRLCATSEGSGYGKFASKLADNFQTEIKKYFPKIDFIGVEV